MPLFEQDKQKASTYFLVLVSCPEANNWNGNL